MALITLQFKDPYSWHTAEEWAYLDYLERTLQPHEEEILARTQRALEDLVTYGEAWY